MTTLSTGLEPFFAAILASPDDDAPRMALADHLDAHGDLRGEHIRLACQIERMELDDPARAELVARAASLPRFSWFTLNPPWNTGFVARRGFVDEVNVTAAWFIRYGDDITRGAPVRTLKLLGAYAADSAALAQTPALARLRALVVPSVHGDGDELIALGRSPHLARLHTLRVESFTLDRALMRRMERERVFPGLRRLELLRATVRPDVWPELVRFLDARGTTTLDLTGTGAPPAVLAGLRDHFGRGLLPPPERRGTRPDDLRARTRFGTLDLSRERGALDTATLRRIVSEGPFPDVTTLSLCGCPIGDAGVEAIARGGAFPSLRALRLDDAGVTAAAAARVLATATSLPSLASASLGDVVDTAPDGTLPADDAVLALARSAALPSLAEVHVSRTWRAYSEGACEEVVTQTVAHAAGRSVTVFVHHDIWP